MRVTILHNAVPADAPPEDQDTLVEVDAVSSALTCLGHTATTLACSLDLAAMREDLLRLRPDVVFNLVESLAGADSLVYLPAAVLDTLGLPYCGSRTESLFLTTHKTLAKQRMRQAGLPTPDWMENHSTIHEEHEGHEERQKNLEDDRWREGTIGCPSISFFSCPSCSSWIVKGVWDQGSRGMDDDAVVRHVGLAELRARLCERAAQSGRPCFAEQFIEGREFNLSVLAGRTAHQTLPPAEIVFSHFPPDKPQIVGHRAKWQADSFECRHTNRCFDFPASDIPLLARLDDLAHQCWQLFDLRGWARVDFRVDSSGQPWLLEVNANPCISPDAGFAAALERASISYEEGIRRILEDTVS
jgi:D-alanine-D-alanine ligase